MPADFRQIALRIGRFLLTALIACPCQPLLAAPWQQTTDERPSATALAAQRYLTALLRNPRPGTSFDRVYSWHADRGTVTELRNALLQLAINKGAIAGDQVSFQPLAEQTPQNLIELPADCPPDAALCIAAIIDLRHGEPEFAAVILRRAAELRPKDPVTHWLLAKALDQSEDGTAAIAAFEAALTLRPARTDLADLHRDYARSLERQRQPAAALAVWQRLEQAFPGDQRVLRQVARALAQDGRWTDALQRYQQLVAAADDSTDRIAGQLDVAESLTQLDRREDALLLLQQLLPELDPEAWLYRDVRSRIEQLYRSANDLAGLVRLYETRLTEQPQDLDVMQRLARVLLELDRGEEAREWLARALRLAPENQPLREAWIAALTAAGQHAEAATALEGWIRAESASPQQLQQLGLLQLARSDLPPGERRKFAVAAFEQLARAATTAADPRLLRQAADLMERAAQFDRAEQLLQAAFNSNPGDDNSRDALGMFLHRRQRRKEAIEVWSGIAAGDLKSPSSLGQLADTLRRAGYLTEALAARREACTLNPELDDRLRFVELLLDVASPEPGTSTQYFDEASAQLDLADNTAADAPERNRILELRIRLLLASDRLEQALKTERAKVAAAVPNAAAPSSAKQPTAADWRRLSAYEAAAGQTAAAAAACLQVVQLEPDSAADWNLLVQLYERAGQLGDAATALRRLMELDRRGWTGYQQQLVRLELQQGRADQAVAAATELTSAAPGSVDAWQFLAETAFAAGRPTEGVAALRRAVRASPADVSALRSLARTLADEFQTPEALELTWRAFELSIDDQERRDLAAQLAHLALRSGRWQTTQDRFEQWQRSQSDSLQAARAYSTLLQEAGRFTEARAALEPLLHTDPENSVLLAELANLAERERNTPLAAQYMLQLYHTSGSLADLRRLLALDNTASTRSSIDKVQLLRDAAAAAASRSDFHAVVQLAAARELTAPALSLCLERLNRDPDDWWTLYQAASLTQTAGDLTTAAALWQKLLNLPLTAASTPAVSQPLPATAQNAATNQSPALVPVNVAAPPATDSGPASFGEAVTHAIRQVVQHDGTSGLKAVLEQGFVDRHGLALIMAAFSVSPGQQNLSLTSETIQLLLQFLSGRSDAAAAEFRLTLLQTQLKLARNTARHAQQLELEQQLATAALQVLEQSTSSSANLRQFSPEQLRGPARQLWATGLLQLVQSPAPAPAPADAADAADPTSLSAERAAIILHQAALLRDEQLLAALINRLSRTPLTESQRTSLQQTCGDAAIAGWISELRQVDSVQLWLKLLTSTDVWGPERISVRLLTSVQPGALQFRHQAGVPGTRERLLSACISRGLQLSAGTAGELWQQWFGNAGGLTEFEGRLLRAEIQRQRGDLTALLQELTAAAAASPAEWHLRIWLAEQLPAFGLVDESLALLEQLPRTDVRAAIDAELLALNVCLAADRQPRAREAALRLSGLPLSDAQQQRLIPVLGRLDLPDVLRAVEVRLGRGTETRTGVLFRKLQTALAGGNQQLGGELAWELLRLSSGGSLFSGYRPADDRDDGGERLQALKALAQVGRIQELSDRYEAMLRSAPDSLPLLELLAELDDAAGNTAQLAQRQDRIAALSGRASPGRRKQAMELESSGDVSAACNIYLQILSEDPATFNAEAETFYQAFERARRIGDFLNGVLQLDAGFWREHGRLLATAVAAAAAAGDPASAAAIANAAARLLENDDTRRLALGTLMNRPGLISDVQVTTAFQQELKRLAAADQRSLTDLLTGCSELLQLATVLERSELLRPIAAAAAEPGVQPAVRVVRIAAAARIASKAEVEAGTAQLLTEFENEFTSPETAAAAVELVLLLQQRLTSQGAQWSAIREQLLRRSLAFTAANGLPEEQLRGALAEFLQQSGRGSEARQLLLDRLRTSNLNADGRSATGIRELLKAAEQVQYSGYPVESAELLASISAYELEQFTKTLEADRASAFRSRWNAALRWSQQQLQAERLTQWLEAQLEERSQRNPLLLVLDGPSDPGETNAERLHETVIASLLLDAICRQDFTAEPLRERVRQLLSAFQKLPDPDVGHLCACAAFADRAGLVAERDQLLDLLLKHPRLQLTATPTAINTMPRSVSEELVLLPEAGFAILAEKLLAAGSISAERAQQMWQASTRNAGATSQRLPRIALFNRISSAARRSNLTAVADEYEALAMDLITVQQQSGQQSTAAGSLTEQVRALLGK